MECYSAVKEYDSSLLQQCGWSWYYVVSLSHSTFLLLSGEIEKYEIIYLRVVMQIGGLVLLFSAAALTKITAASTWWHQHSLSTCYVLNPVQDIYV